MKFLIRARYGDRVASLKKQICRIYDANSDTIRLFFGGSPLLDTYAIAKYNIKQYDVIHLVLPFYANGLALGKKEKKDIHSDSVGGVDNVPIEQPKIPPELLAGDLDHSIDAGTVPLSTITEQTAIHNSIITEQNNRTDGSYPSAYSEARYRAYQARLNGNIDIGPGDMWRDGLAPKEVSTNQLPADIAAKRRREDNVGMANDGSSLLYTQQSTATAGIAVGAVSTHARSESHLGPIMTLSEKRKEEIIMTNCGRYHVKYVDKGMPKKERDLMHNNILRERKSPCVEGGPLKISTHFW